MRTPLVLALLWVGCPSSSEADPCAGASLEACRANLLYCEATTRCAGAAPACADVTQCSPATCAPGYAMCLIARDGGCVPGRVDAGYDCVTEGQSCRVRAEACADCRVELVRCVKRPGPLFGR
jgi:hypothetical protein